MTTPRRVSSKNCLSGDEMKKGGGKHQATKIVAKTAVLEQKDIKQ